MNTLDNFIEPVKEMTLINEAFSKYSTVIVTGAPGIGKTTLAKYYEFKNTLNFEEIYFFRGLQFEFDESKFFLINERNINNKQRLVIIDGLDELVSINIREKLLKLIKKRQNNGTKLLITSRPVITNTIIDEKIYQIQLKSWSREQILNLLKLYFGNSLSNSFVDEYNKVADAINNMPLLLRMTMELIKHGNATTKDILELLNEKTHYKSEVLSYYPSNKIIIPETPEIITDIRLVNSNIINKINRNPSLIYQLGARKFEELVADLFEKEGYNVKLTKATRDGGKDLLIIEQQRIGNFIIYVECKNYSMTNPVGVRLVRELYGTVMADKATAGVLVTSSYFSNPAIEFKEQVKSQLSLLDYYDLKKWIFEKANK